MLGIWLLLMTLWIVLPLHAHARSFPSTPDATEAEQQRWGSHAAGYISEGCWFTPPPSGTTVTLQPCRAFALETGDAGAMALKGFHETGSRTLTLSGGDGRYWIAGRTSPGLAVPGWTCLEGVHYCWVKSDPVPAAVSGLLVLLQVQITAGVVGQPVLVAPLRRTTPYTVPAGVTLVLGACPAGAAGQLWHADGVTSGLVRFGPGACGRVRPEWWGADATGLVDSTAPWQQAIDAVSGFLDLGLARIPLDCEGVYKITGPLTVRPFLGIVGQYKPSTTGQRQVACQFNYEGSGSLFVGPDIGQSYGDLDFRHLRIIDVHETAAYAFNLDTPSGMTMENIFVQGFATAYLFNGQIIYSALRGLGARLYRNRCLEISRTANFADIDVFCSGSRPGAQYGVVVGFLPGEFGVSTNFTLRASVEVASGLPIQIGRVRGLNAQLYVEQPGPCADYSTFGAVYLRGIEGGRVHLTLHGNCQPVEARPAIGRGLYIIDATAGDPSSGVPNTSNLLITGRIFPGTYTYPVVIEPGPGQWGINLTGLDYEVGPSVVGSFTTGVIVGGNYWTHGGAPALNEGKGYGTQGWDVGDLIQTSGGANEGANMFWQVTGAGNPPTMQRLLLPAIYPRTVAPTVAVPATREGNTFLTRLLLDGGAGSTNITDFGNAVGGVCLDLQALAARTLVHSVGATGLKLRGSTDYAMAAGNTLRLCADGPLGPWREQSRCDTCVP